MDKIKILGGNMKKFELSFCTYFKRIEQFKYAHETYDECVAFFVKSGSFAYKIEGESEQTARDGEVVFCPKGKRFDRKIIEPAQICMIKFT